MAAAGVREGVRVARQPASPDVHAARRGSSGPVRGPCMGTLPRGIGRSAPTCGFGLRGDPQGACVR
jgi:hypothetical protein